jgi:ectoine hydroxylase-related dioxygenase (phytanoyl-CoA dioxygenase family)
MLLSNEQLAAFRTHGHLTVHDVFSPSQIRAANDDLEVWGAEFKSTLAPEDEQYYFEQSKPDARALRKLDNPVHARPFFRQLANDPNLLSVVHKLIGHNLRVVFSQVFLKPSEVGGAKPVHQDNFYFGPADKDKIITVWIAIDNATVENGCMFFANGSNQGPVHQHVAPPGEPFNLQVPPEIAQQYEMTPEPVPSGAVSFHHGNVMHQSSPNRSDQPRRAVAMHFLSDNNYFELPALKYDESVIVQIPDAQ